MRFLTNEEIEIRKEKSYKRERKAEFFEKVLSLLRCIFFPPLSTAFHLVSFVSRGIGFIASFGLIVGVYNLYQSFVAFRNNVPLAEIETLSKGVSFIILPFIVYAIAEITERIYVWFEDNTF